MLKKRSLRLPVMVVLVTWTGGLEGATGGGGGNGGNAGPMLIGPRAARVWLTGGGGEGGQPLPAAEPA